MEPCSSSRCVLNRFRNRFFPNATDATPPPDNTLLSTSSFRILLPIIVVLGIMITTAIVFIAHKIVTKYLYKHWVPENENSRNGTTRGGTARSRSVISTISGNNSDLPSYGQVMQAIEREELPPPYYKVASGTVNLGFSEEAERVANEQTTQNSIRNISHADLSASSNERLESDHVTLGEEATGNGATLSNAVSEPTRNAEVIHVLPQEVAADPNTVTSVYQSTTPTAGEPVTIVIHDIDDVINSISVPSILTTEHETLSQITAKTKTAKQKRRQGTYFGRTTSFSSSNRIRAPKTSSVIMPTPLDSDTVLSMECTPV